jgi:hypothetical protein
VCGRLCTDTGSELRVHGGRLESGICGIPGRACTVSLMDLGLYGILGFVRHV